MTPNDVSQWPLPGQWWAQLSPLALVRILMPGEHCHIIQVYTPTKVESWNVVDLSGLRSLWFEKTLNFYTYNLPVRVPKVGDVYVSPSNGVECFPPNQLLFIGGVVPHPEKEGVFRLQVLSDFAYDQRGPFEWPSAFRLFQSGPDPLPQEDQSPDRFHRDDPLEEPEAVMTWPALID